MKIRLAFSRALAEAAGRHGPDQTFNVTALVLVVEHPEQGRRRDMSETGKSS